MRLPARREDVELHTPDGLRLVGELALPADRDPVATLVCLHPLPTHGGYMDSHVLLKASQRLPALAGVAVLRFNLRGVSSPRGTSARGPSTPATPSGTTSPRRWPSSRTTACPAVTVLGWSFGTDLALRHARDPLVAAAGPAVARRCGSPPRRTCAGGPPTAARSRRWSPSTTTTCARPRPAERFALVPQARVVPLVGAKHLVVGESNVRTVLDHVVEAVAPGAHPLPTTWDGPYERVTTRITLSRGGPRGPASAAAVDRAPLGALLPRAARTPAGSRSGARGPRTRGRGRPSGPRR